MGNSKPTKKELADRISALESKERSEGLTIKERNNLRKLRIKYTHKISGFNRVKVVSGGAAGSQKR